MKISVKHGLALTTVNPTHPAEFWVHRFIYRNYYSKI